MSGAIEQLIQPELTSAWISSSTWMPFADPSRPVNSGVRCFFWKLDLTNNLIRQSLFLLTLQIILIYGLMKVNRSIQVGGSHAQLTQSLSNLIHVYPDEL